MYRSHPSVQYESLLTSIVPALDDVVCPLTAFYVCNIDFGKKFPFPKMHEIWEHRSSCLIYKY